MDDINFLREYFRVKIKFIKRFKKGGYQKRWQAYFIETGILITTQKKLPACVKEASRAQTRAINQAIEEQLVLF